MKAEQTKIAAVIAAEGDAKAAELIAKALGDAGDGNTIFKLLFSIKCSCYL
jgi:prohibitin 1